MISRAHGLALSVLLGAASAAGAYALMVTADLGGAQTKPEVVSGHQIAARARKLDAWEASLRKTLEARPPALPALNRYAAVTFVAAPGPSSLPAPAVVPLRSATQATSDPKHKRPTSKPPATGPGKRREKRIDVIATPIHDDDAPDSAAPVAAPGTGTPTPTPSPAVVAAVAAPVTTSPTTLSVEQQCRLLLRAAENKSEQVKQEAERQCEALKNAAERKG